MKWSLEPNLGFDGKQGSGDGFLLDIYAEFEALALIFRVKNF